MARGAFGQRRKPRSSHNLFYTSGTKMTMRILTGIAPLPTAASWEFLARSPQPQLGHFLLEPLTVDAQLPGGGADVAVMSHQCPLDRPALELLDQLVLGFREWQLVQRFKVIVLE